MIRGAVDEVRFSKRGAGGLLGMKLGVSQFALNLTINVEVNNFFWKGVKFTPTPLESISSAVVPSV